MTIKDHIRIAFDAFDKVMDKYAKYGAADSEPDAVAQVYVARTLGFSNKPAKLPCTANAWELYSDMPGVTDAVLPLTTALTGLTAELKALYFEPGAPDAIREYLWRVSC